MNSVVRRIVRHWAKARRRAFLSEGVGAARIFGDYVGCYGNIWCASLAEVTRTPLSLTAQLNERHINICRDWRSLRLRKGERQKYKRRPRRRYKNTNKDNYGYTTPKNDTRHKNTQMMLQSVSKSSMFADETKRGRRDGEMVIQTGNIDPTSCFMSLVSER